MEGEVIVVRPKERLSWHKMNLLAMNKLIDTNRVISALVDTATFKFKSGLDNIDRCFPNKEGEPQKLTEQGYYGMLIGKDLDPTPNEDEDHPFFHGVLGMVKIKKFRDTVFNTKNPLKYIHVKILEQSGFVEKDKESAIKNPEATHYFHSKTKELRDTSSLVERKQNLIIKLHGFAEDLKTDLILLASGNDLSKASKETIILKVDSLLNNHLKVLERFASLPKVEISIWALIKRCISKGIIELDLSDGKLFFNEKSIGRNEEEALKFLKQNINQKVLISLKQKMNT